MNLTDPQFVRNLDSGSDVDGNKAACLDTVSVCKAAGDPYVVLYSVVQHLQKSMFYFLLP